LYAQSAPAESSATKRRVRYYLDPNIGVHSSPEASLLKPHIVRLTDELVKAYDLQKDVTICARGTPALPLLPPQGACRFHTDSYVRFLQQIATNGIDIVDEAANYALNSSVCFSETAWEYSQIYAGASVEGAGSVASGAADVAINWMGGQTHARRDGASGFSYVNDVVLAILSMLHTHERVLFVSTDAWHPSGVEEAFYTTDRVLCVSLHRHTDGFFPGSGGADDRGVAAGVNHTINMPVSEGLDDDQITSLFVPVVAAAAERFQPSCVVYCAGAGVLSGDRLGCLNVTLEGYGRCLQAVLDIGRPLLVLGGCGFNQINTARAWCHATAMICETEVAEELPPHDFVEYYLPESTLKVSAIEMTNKNSAESIQATLEASMQAAQQIPARAAAPAPPKAAAADADTATGATPAGSTEADGKLTSPGLTANEALLASPSFQPLPGNGTDVPLDAASALEPAAKVSADAPVPMETESEAAVVAPDAAPSAMDEEGGVAVEDL